MLNPPGLSGEPFVRLVSYPHDVDARLQAVVLLQAYLLFVLHDCTAHADDDDLLTLRCLNIEAAILRIDLHALDRFDTRRVFFFFRTFGLDVDVRPDVINGVFARLRAFLQFFPCAVVATFVIDFEVVEGVVLGVLLDIDEDRASLAYHVVAGGDFHAGADIFLVDVVVVDGFDIIGVALPALGTSEHGWYHPMCSRYN